MNTNVIVIIAVIIEIYLTIRSCNRIIFPYFMKRDMKEVDRNPNWVVSKLQYYGFNDIDIVLYESKMFSYTQFRGNKDKSKLEFWIPNETSIDEVPEIGRIALVGKLKAKYGLWFPDKPIHWLSILCFMLDGGDINMEDKIPEKPVKE